MGRYTGYGDYQGVKGIMGKIVTLAKVVIRGMMGTLGQQFLLYK